MGMANVGRPSVWDEHAPEMQRMYEDDKLSRGEVARRFGTSVQTVTRVLERHGVVFEDRPGNPNAGRSPERQAEINAKISAAKTGVPLGERAPAESRTCEECGQEYEYRPGRAGERFCSRKCRTDFQVKLNQEEARADYDQHPKLCPCGGAIPYEYRHTRQFCSPEHRKEYQSYRVPDPANYVTFDCLNCGKTVTRLKNYGGNLVQKYCSNECSAKHNRTKQHIVVEDAMVLDSPYEALFYGLMRLWKIPAERADRSHAQDVNGSGWYCPDFYLPGLDIWVEVKGFEDDNHRARYAGWRMSGRKLTVLRREELHTLMTRANGNVVAEQIKIWAG
jgi:hypothetical protein